MEAELNSGLPPGFRFHPTDEELIIHYLCNQATSKPCAASIIPEVDIYKFDAWELPGNQPTVQYILILVSKTLLIMNKVTLFAFSLFITFTHCTHYTI